LRVWLLRVMCNYVKILWRVKMLFLGKLMHALTFGPSSAIQEIWIAIFQKNQEPRTLTIRFTLIHNALMKSLAKRNNIRNCKRNEKIATVNALRWNKKAIYRLTHTYIRTYMRIYTRARVLEKSFEYIFIFPIFLFPRQYIGSDIHHGRGQYNADYSEDSPC